MIKIAIIGAGHIGSVHAKAIDQIDEVKLVAVHDVLKTKAESFAEKNGCHWYTDINDMFDQEKIDAVAICTPTFLHAKMAEFAADKKKHIFCEKPLALSLTEADRMIEAVKMNNVKSMTGHILRFWPAYTKIKEIVDSGEIGKPLHGYCERLMTAPPWAENAWNKNEKYSGGAALDIQIHDADYIIWLLGEPKIVKSEGAYSPAWGGWMHMGTTIQFAGGASALLQVGWGFPRDFPFTNTIRITCEKGTAEWMFRVGMDSWKNSEKSFIRIYKFDGKSRDERISDDDQFLLEWRYFIDCLRSGKGIYNSSFEDGRKALELVLASVKSVREKSVVCL